MRNQFRMRPECAARRFGGRFELPNPEHKMETT
jgi:hypothetical protein